MALASDHVGNEAPLPTRPKTRAECAGVERPCPFVSCSHNFYLDVDHRGRIKFNSPALTPDQIPADRSCALDLAESGPQSFRVIGEILRITRQGAQLIERNALEKLRRMPAKLADELHPEPTRYHLPIVPSDDHVSRADQDSISAAFDRLFPEKKAMSWKERRDVTMSKEGKGARILSLLRERGELSSQELFAAGGCADSEQGLSVALSLMVQRGSIVRVSKGVYAIATAAQALERAPIAALVTKAAQASSPPPPPFVRREARPVQVEVSNALPTHPLVNFAPSTPSVATAPISTQLLQLAESHERKAATIREFVRQLSEVA